MPSNVSSDLMRALEAALRAAPEERDALLDAAVQALAAAHPSEIPAGVDDRRALWINVYNVLTLHSVRGRRGGALSALVRTVFLRYPIAGKPTTLDDVEHGFLRDNARPPHRPLRTLGPKDSRHAWRVPRDPRVHFALNCGARSCPLIRVYSGARLDEQLASSERSFLGAETRIDRDRRVVTTSRLLHFYKSDFEGDRGILRRIERALEVERESLGSYRLRFDRYDFTAAVRFAGQ